MLGARRAYRGRIALVNPAPSRRSFTPWLLHRYFAHSGDQLPWRMEAVTHHQATAALVSLPLVPFGVFSHFCLQSHLQHLSSPFPEEFLQIRLQLVPGYALHLNCRIFPHERILSPSAEGAVGCCGLNKDTLSFFAFHYPIHDFRIYLVVPRAPQILIGFPTRLLPEQNNRVEPILMTSRDGRRFKRWPDPVIPEDAPEERAGNRSNYMAWGLVPTPGNDREYSVYASENYLSMTPTRLRRFTYRLDGFVALSGGEQGGQLTTRPLLVAGGQLEINYLTRPGGRVRVEIQDDDGQPLANFSADDCDLLEGDEIAETVTWKTDGHGPFAGRPVRVRFEVKDADLFSFRFR